MDSNPPWAAQPQPGPASPCVPPILVESPHQSAETDRPECQTNKSHLSIAFLMFNHLWNHHLPTPLPSYSHHTVISQRGHGLQLADATLQEVRFSVESGHLPRGPVHDGKRVFREWLDDQQCQGLSRRTMVNH